MPPCGKVLTAIRPQDKPHKHNIDRVSLTDNGGKADTNEEGIFIKPHRNCTADFITSLPYLFLSCANPTVSYAPAINHCNSTVPTSIFALHLAPFLQNVIILISCISTRNTTQVLRHYAKRAHPNRFCTPKKQ